MNYVFLIDHELELFPFIHSINTYICLKISETGFKDTFFQKYISGLEKSKLLKSLNDNNNNYQAM